MVHLMLECTFRIHIIYIRLGLERHRGYMRGVGREICPGIND